MSFVVIVEPEQSNAERIRAILEAVECKFEYELVTAPERAIDIVESRKVDVFISAMELKIMTANELFSMLEMVSPDTVRVVMTDAAKTADTVTLMNKCKIFKIIIKPCRLAEDLITPIETCLEYQVMKARIQKEAENNHNGVVSMEQDFQKLESIWNEGLVDFQRIKDVFQKMLEANIGFGNMNPDTEAILKDWYSWLLDTYEKVIIEGNGNWETCRNRLIEQYHDPDRGCLCQIKKMFSDGISNEKTHEIIFMIQIMAEACKRIAYKYHLKAVVEAAEKAYILRIACAPLGDSADSSVYRKESEPARKQLECAIEEGIAALGNKSITMKKGNELIFNIAVRK